MKKQQLSNNLLASIAVFAELTNTQQDIQGIIAEFIKSVYAIEKNWSLDSNEVTLLLKKHFDFDIPEAVVKTCLNSMTNKGITYKTLGKYAFVDKSYSAQSLSDKLSSKKRAQEAIETELINYCEKFKKKKLTSTEKNDLIQSFISYLMDNGVSDTYATTISSFVVGKSAEDSFVKELNQLKEGLVLVTGLRYTNDIHNLGAWKDELTVYLETEHLFNSEGYNGEVFQRLFNDFFSLVNEINQASLKRDQKKIIHLKYFEETKEEVDRFFHMAEKIIKREDNHSPENIAMESICKGCSDVNDVLRKKAVFETSLQTRGIKLHQELEYYSKPEYNIEDLSLIGKYEQRNTYDELANVLRSFTKINYLRRGQNRTNFEKCGHIILTGKTIWLLMSMDLQIKNESKDIPFATDIYFITNRIWYRLNKGLSKTDKLPATLDVITKAQTVLSAQINRSVDKQFESLKEELKQGKIDQDTAQIYYYNLREKARKPEDIKPENINESIDFIFENDIESFLREKSNLEHKAKQGEIALKKLKNIEASERKKKNRKIKLKARLLFGSVASIFWTVLLLLPVAVGFILIKLRGTEDSWLTVIGVLLTVFVAWGGLFKYAKPFLKWLQIKCQKFYLRSIKNIK